MSIITQRAKDAALTELAEDQLLAEDEGSELLVQISQGLAFGLIALATLAALAYLIAALDFGNKPFAGLFLNRNLTVRDTSSYAEDERWPGLRVGILPDDKITGLEETAFPAENGIERFNALIGEAEDGQDIVLEVTRKGVRSGIATADRCTLNTNETSTICRVPVPLAKLPVIDLFAYFGIGFIAGVVALVVGMWVLVRRFSQPPAQFFAGIAATIAIVEMGRFNFLSTHQPSLAYLWILAGTMLAGLLISFSTVFPTRIASLDRLPALSYAPIIAALIVGGLLAYLYQQGENFALIVPLVLIALGTGVMVALMFWRRQYTTSPIFREQASYVLLGASFGIVPLVAWMFYELVARESAPLWVVPLVQIVALLLLVSVAYALLQDRLLETDRLVPTILVYNLLGGVLIVSYALVVWGLSRVGIESVSSDSPVFVALVVLVIALGFVPVRSRLHEQINEVWFRRRRQYQAKLETLLNSLTNAINVGEVERAVRTVLDDVLAPSDVILFVRDKETQVFRAYERVSSGRPVTDITFAFNSGLAQHLETEASVVYLEEGKALPPNLMQNRSQLAVLNTPVLVRLMGQRQMNGFLAVSARRNALAYTYDDLQFIEKVADQAALALERTRIVEDLEHRFRVQDVLSQVSRALSYAIDFDTLMELLYAQSRRVIETDIFAIAIVELNASQLYYAFFVEGDERLDHLEQRRWDMGSDLISEVARSQQLIRVDDYAVALRQRSPNADIQTHIKAWMGAPLTTDTVSGTLGVVVVGTTDPTIRYSDEQVQLFLDIASLAASAINKTRLFEATQVRTRQLEALNQISSQLSTAISDLDHLLDLISRNALDILKCQAGSLLLVDQESGDLVFHVALGPSAQELVGQRIPKDRPSLANEALRRAESVIVNDTATDSRWHGEVLRDAEDEAEEAPGFHSRAILTTPLLTQGEPIGVLQIINKRDGSPFTQDDATLLTTFAAQAAVAIQNARLYALQDERLIQRVAELEGLAAIDQTLNQTLELQKVAIITLDWAVRQSGAAAGAMAIIEAEDTPSMRLIASQGYPLGAMFAPEAVGQTFSTDMGIWGRVIRTATPSFSRNLMGSKEDNFPADPDYIETYPGAVSQIIMPIISGGSVIGILLVESDKETDLTLLDMEFLTRLADHASPAIANAQLFDQVRFQQQARSEFVSFIAHELKTPMTSMKGYTDLLMRGVVGPLNEQQTNFLHTIFNSVNRLEALVNDLRDVENLDSMKLDMGAADFGQIVRESLRPLQQAFEKKEQNVVLAFEDVLPQVWADQKRLIQIMTNFLTNGNKYTPVGGTITVKAEKALNEWDKEGVRRVLHVEVKDTGIGISLEDQQRLFREKYFRTENAIATDEPGTGLGMVLTRGLILGHGGQVWVESEIGHGSTFHFTLPLADEILREAM